MNLYLVTSETTRTIYAAMSSGSAIRFAENDGKNPEKIKLVSRERVYVAPRPVKPKVKEKEKSMKETVADWKEEAFQAGIRAFHAGIPYSTVLPSQRKGWMTASVESWKKEGKP